MNGELKKDQINDLLDDQSENNIEVNDGVVLINAQEVSIEDFSGVFLEKIVDLSLQDKIHFNIIGDSPIGRFFDSIRKGTQKDSELRNLFENCKEVKISS